MLWERAVVGGEVKVGNSDGAGETSEGAGDMRTVLERHVVVEAGAIVEAGARVGEGSVVEVGARVGSGCVLGEVSEDLGLRHRIFRISSSFVSHSYFDS